MASDSSFVKNKFVLAALLVILVASLVVYINSTTGFLTFSPIISTPAKQPTLISYAGNTPPVIDGQITNLDKWGEAGSATSTYESGVVQISSKHDSRYIYFLVQWDDQSPAWNDGVAFYFEDDGLKHDHSLDGIYDYSFQNLPAGCKVIAGNVWGQGGSSWAPAGADFDVACSYEKGKWTAEFKHVLSDALRKDKMFRILPSQEKLMGFAVVNWESGMPGGQGMQSWSWPVDQTFGKNTGTNPNEPATWGDLKVVWTLKNPPTKKSAIRK